MMMRFGGLLVVLVPHREKIRNILTSLAGGRAGGLYIIVVVMVNARLRHYWHDLPPLTPLRVCTVRTPRQVTPVYSAAWPGGDTKGHNDLVESVTALLPRLHSLAVGPGMGRDPRVLRALADILPEVRSRNLPVVLDADAIAMVVMDPETVRGYPLAVLTPNANEFRLLCEKMGDASLQDRGRAEWLEDDDDELASKAEAAERLATFLGNVTIVLKGKVDVISNGNRTITCNVAGGLKRCGGIGDVLSGAMATSLAWVSIQGFHGAEVKGAVRVFGGVFYFIFEVGL